MPPAPVPNSGQVAWARRVLGEDHQAPAADRVAATRVLQAAGIDPAPHDGREPDSAPAGAREIGEGMREREAIEDEARGQAREEAVQHRAGELSGKDAPKADDDRGAHLGPGHGKEPGHPEASDFDRRYVTPGHASPSPMAEGPRSSPLPTGPHGITPVQLAADAIGSQIPAQAMRNFSLGSPSER
jgi:hypothetical protein